MTKFDELVERCAQEIHNGLSLESRRKSARSVLVAAGYSDREGSACLSGIASNEPCNPDETLKRCTICGLIVDVKYKAEFPTKSGIVKGLAALAELKSNGG